MRNQLQAGEVKGLDPELEPTDVPDNDPPFVLKVDVAALDQWVLNSYTTKRATRSKTVQGLGKCMVRRSSSATIDAKRIGESLLEFQRIRRVY